MFPGPLRAFYEAVRGGSIRKASEALNQAPSSISRQIGILERQMGTALFDRTATGVTLTRSGELIADYARAALLGFDSLRADIADVKGVGQHLIKLTTVEGIVSEGAIAAIIAFRAKYPRVSFQLKILPAPRVIDVVRLGETDIGITFCGQPHVDIKTEIKIPDPIVAVAAPACAFSSVSSVSLSDLRTTALAMPETNFGIRQIVDRAAHAQGFALSPVVSTDSFEALRSFARRGAGVAVMARRSVRDDVASGRLKAIDIDEPTLRATTIDVITLKNRRLSVILKFFLRELKDVCEASAL